MKTAEKIVFFNRSKPQGADVLKLCVKHNVVFIGYPLWKKEVTQNSAIDPLKMTEWVADISCDKQWEVYQKPYKYKENRNLVKELAIGSIAIIPRPSKGCVYVGIINSDFILDDKLKWADEYLELRRNQKLDTEEKNGHLGDICQYWKVEEFHEIPFSTIPAWIRKSFFGRSTFGRIHNIEKEYIYTNKKLNAHQEMLKIIKNYKKKTVEITPYTSCIEETKKRLLTHVTPSELEHLMVQIMQLNEPENVWRHVGGSGDDGADGLGTNNQDEQIGIIQCKWKYDGKNLSEYESLLESNKRVIFASLLHNKALEYSDKLEFYSIDTIAKALIKHSEKIPLAITLRIRGE